MNMKYADNFKLLLNEKLCDIADAVLRYYDPCQLEENKCLITDDIAEGSCHCCFHYDGKTGCWLRRDGQCQVRVISCKVWLCDPAQTKADPDCLATLKDIERIAVRYGLVRTPLMGQRYAGRDLQRKAAKAKEGTNK